MNKLPTCEICPKPRRIIEENQATWELFSKIYDSTQPDGMSGVTLADIRLFDIYATSEGVTDPVQRKTMLDKITLINKMIKQTKAEQQRNTDPKTNSS